MKARQQIAKLKENFQKLDRRKLTRQMRLELGDCLKVLDTLQEIERQERDIRKGVRDLIASLSIHYAMKRLQSRKRKNSTKGTERFWREERRDA